MFKEGTDFINFFSVLAVLFFHFSIGFRVSRDKKKKKKSGFFFFLQLC